MTRSLACLVLSLALVPSSTPLSAAEHQIDPLDWPMWRGPEQNGISRETGLVDSWDPKGENLLWKNTEAGTISTPIIMHGRLYVLCRDQPDTKAEREKVLCLDAVTGEKLWEHAFNVFLSDVPAERVGWSSCVGDPATGRVYAMGVCGYFLCLDGETGEALWTRSLSEEFGLLSTYGGRTNIPILFEDLVITSAVIIGWGDMARPAHRFLAFDKQTGEVVWFSGTRPLPEDTTYSTPIVTTLNGQAAIVFASGDGGVYAMQPRTGNIIWNYQFSLRGINTTPVVVDDVVYAGHSEENLDATSMGALAAIRGDGQGDISQAGTIWSHKEVPIGKSSPLVIGDRIYAIDDSAGLWIFDTATGEPVLQRKQKLATMMRSSPVYADGKIYCSSVDGRFYILRPSDDGVEIIHRGRLPRDEEVYGSPVVSHGRIYVTTTGGVYCIGQTDHQVAATERPPLASETAVEQNSTPAHVQVVPAEVLMHPGTQQSFRVRLFNARGQFLRESEAKFTVDQAGEIDASGQFTADSAAAHVAAVVTAQVGDLTGTARIRLVPPLPWSFDFVSGEVPITWVGARYRHIVRELDGRPVMVKVTTIPKGTRSQAWMGHPELHDYTIQADVRGATDDGKLPDIGLIAQRYTLDLMGNNQELQVRTWTPQLARMSKTVPFSWQADTWYTIKFRAAVENGHAVLRGKVWPRDEAEPDAWHVTAIDETPSVVGSPGLFGNATNAEIFIDNIKVTPN